MRKLIMFVFLVLSLFAMIAFTVSLSDLMGLFGLGSVDFNDILDLLQNTPVEEWPSTFGLLLYGLFQLYGIPLAIFLISWNGLATKKA